MEQVVNREGHEQRRMHTRRMLYHADRRTVDPPGRIVIQVQTRLRAPRLGRHR